MLGRRAGRGGLLRVAATTAVVAGTATAVSGGIRGRQDAKAQQAAEAQAYEQQQQQAQMDAAAQQAVAQQQAYQAPPPPAPAAPAASAGDDLMTQIQNLATMHSQGILSDDEFAAAKAKLLT
ncbi:SHOCT domain-containing protein [Leifsonia sp. NPDC058248]|uniref:SHOCT domain-containing protein n=1 Tax=Leifsonia sp. NPDC058248 TaxID=3346402 RepID=UPI0036DDBC1C